MGQNKEEFFLNVTSTRLSSREEVYIPIRTSDHKFRLAPKGHSFSEEAHKCFHRFLVIIAKIHVEKEFGLGSFLEDLKPHQVDVVRLVFSNKRSPFGRDKKRKPLNVRVGEGFRKGLIRFNF